MAKSLSSSRSHTGVALVLVIVANLKLLKSRKQIQSGSLMRATPLGLSVTLTNQTLDV